MKIYGIIVIFILQSCSFLGLKIDKPCSSYLKQIKKQMKIDSSEILTYQYFENLPEISADCFIGLSNKKVIKILGKPTGKIETYSKSLFYYCFDSKCVKSLHWRGKQLLVTFDSTKSVNKVEYRNEKKGRF